MKNRTKVRIKSGKKKRESQDQKKREKTWLAIVFRSDTNHPKETTGVKEFSAKIRSRIPSGKKLRDYGVSGSGEEMFAGGLVSK